MNVAKYVKNIPNVAIITPLAIFPAIAGVLLYINNVAKVKAKVNNIAWNLFQEILSQLILIYNLKVSLLTKHI